MTWHKYSRIAGAITARNQPWPNTPVKLGEVVDEVYLVVIEDPQPEGFDPETQALVPIEEPLPDTRQCLIHWEVQAK